MHALHHFIIQLGRVGGVTMKTDVVANNQIKSLLKQPVQQPYSSLR